MRRSYHDATRARFFVINAALAALLTLALGLVLSLAFASPAMADEHGAPAVANPTAAGTPTLTPGSASAAASGSAPASASASARGAEASPASAEVRVRDKVVFVFRASRLGRSAAERARTANAAIDGLLSHPEQLAEARFEETEGTAVIFIGKTPILTLGPEDVEANGEASLRVLAAQVTGRTDGAVASERKRSAIATTVFSVSLLVFSGLIAFWLLGRASELADRLRGWMTDNPDRVTAIRLGNIEVVSAGAARGGSSIALTLAYRLLQFAIAYAWLIFGLSLFEATRGYTERLTGLMLTPLYALAARIGSALPVVIVAGLAVLAVSVLVRFIGLFFDSVARGDTKIGWLTRDLARPTSALVRFGVVVIALVAASPLITGESDGALSRVGMVALVAVALASTPLLACAVVGAIVVYGRRLKKGELVEFGGRAGRVQDIGLLDVKLEDAGACEISVPHLLGLFHPTRVHRHPPLAQLDVVIDPAASQGDVEKALLAAARAISSRGRVELVYLDACGAHWRIHSATHRGDKTLGRAVQDALTELGVALGSVRRGPGEERAGSA